jgi:FKBP-type peptidyl-prolyl cis-trans isomerase SlyD
MGPPATKNFFQIMQIEFGKFVAIQYTLTGFEEGEAPEDIEQTSPERPFTFIYGVGQLLPAFEKNIAGLNPGDAFDFQLAPADAYGEYDEEKVAALPKKFFCDANGKFLSQYVMEGGEVPLQNDNGDIIQATVEKITDTEVVCDVNHPLAGMTLHFVGTIQEVREPNEEDKKSYMNATCNAECECGCGSCGHQGECDGDCGGHKEGGCSGCGQKG